jgi:hypothetical protein
MTPITTILAARTALAAAVALGTLAASTQAGAVSLAVKMACASDYYAHCSQFAPDSPQTRQCMRSVGRNLSPGCLSALVAAGEAPKSAIASRVASAK